MKTICLFFFSSMKIKFFIYENALYAKSIELSILNGIITEGKGFFFLCVRLFLISVNEYLGNCRQNDYYAAHLLCVVCMCAREVISEEECEHNVLIFAAFNLITTQFICAMELLARD